MNQADIRKYLKLGIVHFMVCPETMSGEGNILDSVLLLAADNDFEVVEVTRINDPEQRSELATRAAGLGTELTFGAQPILLGANLDLNHPEDAVRGIAIEAVKGGIDQAVELGASSCAVLSGKNDTDKTSATARLVESLSELCAYAGSVGLSIALEQFDSAVFAKNCLIGPTREAVALSEAVRARHDNFGLMMDLSHLPLLNENPAEALHIAKDHLVHAHMGNCAMDDPAHPAYGDNHPGFGVDGTRVGVPELRDYLRALLDIGYLREGQPRIVSFEIKRTEAESAAELVSKSKAALFSAWNEI